ncbi:hypothetical protein HZS_1687 [Henneguya salminicola]|nr:hypothetical protein HZS_1687 [Henneguya salminicola]
MKFKTAPRPFSQCFIVKAYDRATQLFVTFVHAVLTCKNEEMYCTVLREIVVLTKYPWVPVSIPVAFEKGALFRKLKKLLPLKPDIYVNVRLKLIEILTLVPKERISV